MPPTAQNDKLNSAQLRGDMFMRKGTFIIHCRKSQKPTKALRERKRETFFQSYMERKNFGFKIVQEILYKSKLGKLEF